MEKMGARVLRVQREGEINQKWQAAQERARRSVPHICRCLVAALPRGGRGRATEPEGLSERETGGVAERNGGGGWWGEGG